MRLWAGTWPRITRKIPPPPARSVRAADARRGPRASGRSPLRPGPPSGHRAELQADDALGSQHHRRVNIDRLIRHQSEIVLAYERRNDHEHLHDRHVGTQTGPRATTKWDVGELMAISGLAGLEPTRIERLDILPMRRIAM